MRSLTFHRPEVICRLLQSSLVRIDPYLLSVALVVAVTPCLREVMYAAVSSAAAELRAAVFLPLLQLGVLRASMEGDADRAHLMLAFLATDDFDAAKQLAAVVASRVERELDVRGRGVLSLLRCIASARSMPSFMVWPPL